MRKILDKLKNISKKFCLIKKRKNNTFATVFFNNIPITNDTDDIFGFKEQVSILDKAIGLGSTLIGIIGDYGSGKSSLTEICQKKLCRKYGQAIRINMWDTVEQGYEERNFSFLMRSFLYQLAQGAQKWNSNFARYINERQSRNYGKLSLTMASPWALLWFVVAGLFFITFLTLTNNDIFTLLVRHLNENEWSGLLTIANFLQIFSYLLLFISIIFIYLGIKMGAFVFSLWNSQGIMSPEYGDTFDNFIQIINKIIPFRRKKRVIYIEDLDRIDKKELVILFLQELHRFINILPIKHKMRITFIVSLKSESSLKYKLSSRTIEDKSIYSKIFDYTLWIKPIHYENILDIIWELLQQNQKDIKNILGLNKNTGLSKTLLDDLDWIQKGENLTIREIKDRLNETFTLYKTLKARDFEHSSVELKKCCAVAYLHRAYSDEYEKLLKYEQKVAELIRNCYKLQYSDKESINDKIKSTIDNIFDGTTKEPTNFIHDFSIMLFNADIDEDFMMYFYNYPTSSYIKNLDEKEIFDYIIHPSNDFKSDNKLSDKIKRVITQKDGKVIKDAINELNVKKQILPDIIFEEEQLFSFVIKQNKAIVLQTLSKWALVIVTHPNKICYFLERILAFNVNENLKQEIITLAITSIATDMKDHDINKIISARTILIKSVKSYVIHFADIFLGKGMPLITKDEFQLLNLPNEKLALINYRLIDTDNYIYILGEICTLELDEDGYNKAENILEGIKNLDTLQDIHRYLLVFLTKNRKYNSNFFSLILDNVIDEEEKMLCDYLNVIDISQLTIEQLTELDEMRLKDISDEKVILFFEEKKLYQSALLSRVALGMINNFDFIKNDIFSDMLDSFEKIYKKYPDDFLAIRFAAFKQLHDKNRELYKLYFSNFPVISDYEIDLIDDTKEELYMYVDHSSIDITNYKLITEYCNKKIFLGDKLFNFFHSLFFHEDNNISNVDCIKSIFSGIDFKNTILFESMTSEQQKTICDKFSSVYELTIADGSMEFMRIVNCLIPDLEEIISDGLKNGEVNYSDYLALINDIKKPTEETIEIIKDRSLNQALDASITEKLYSKKCFIRYLVGKTLKDNIIPMDENIPLEKYYQAFKLSEKFAKMLSGNIDILTEFVKHKLLDDKLPNNRLSYFYNLRQPLFLIEFMLKQWHNNIDETKKYLHSIKDIDTEDDANSFIRLITSGNYVELLNDRNLFYFLYHKMWNKKLKQKLTFTTNRLLKPEPKYTGKETGDHDFDDSNLNSEENLDQEESP